MDVCWSNQEMVKDQDIEVQKHNQRKEEPGVHRLDKEVLKGIEKEGLKEVDLLLQKLLLLVLVEVMIEESRSQ